MEILGHIWTIYLFEPVFNVLVWLYGNIAHQNFAIAVIYLTIGLRIILLPFSIIEEMGKGKHSKLEKEVAAIEKNPHIDPMKKREVVRKLMREFRVSPWAKIISMFALALLFLLLYQIFVGGLRLEKMVHLYSWNFHPDYINTIFLGFDVAKRYWFLSLIPAALLFVEIVYEQRKYPHLITQSEAVYRYLFPIAVFFLLWKLPSIKSIFILTTMLFTLMIKGVKLTVSKVPKIFSG
jgi:membrane protein insertase Oxa1/YidC/SpoIIIJ